MSGVDALTAANPWPETRPDAPVSTWGWGIEGEALLTGRVPSDAQVVVEIGSLLGASARFWAAHCPNAHVFCVDPWFDVADVADRPFLAHHPELAHFVTTETDGIYRIFLASNWELRHRITPLRGFSPDRLAPLHEHGVRPDVVYIDGSHVYEDVLADVIIARVLFPEAILCGDDWHWPGVQHAVRYVADNRGDRLHTEGNTWLLERGEGDERRPTRSAHTVGPVERSLPGRLVERISRALRRGPLPRSSG